MRRDIPRKKKKFANNPNQKFPDKTWVMFAPASPAHSYSR